MQKEIFFHVGLSKTGTKYFQDLIFPKLKNIKYIPKRRYHKALVLVENSNEQRLLVSQELDRQFHQEIKKWAEKFPQTNIIMVLRRQDSWFASQYRRFVKNGFTGSMQDFIDIRNNKGYFSIEDGLYLSKIQMIKNLFDGKHLFLNYDDLKNFPEKFVKKIIDFLDCEFTANIPLNPRHTSHSEKQLKVMKKIGPKLGVKLRKYNDNNRFVRFWQRLEQLTLRSLVFYLLSNFYTDKKLDNNPLISEEYLTEIKNFYADDWNFAKKYFEKP